MPHVFPFGVVRYKCPHAARNDTHLTRIIQKHDSRGQHLCGFEKPCRLTAAMTMPEAAGKITPDTCCFFVSQAFPQGVFRSNYDLSSKRRAEDFIGYRMRELFLVFKP